MVTLQGRGDHRRAAAKGEAGAGEEVVVEAAAVVVMLGAGTVAGSVTKATFSASNVTTMATMPIAVRRRRRAVMKHTLSELMMLSQR